jgi:hypothetical protein
VIIIVIATSLAAGKLLTNVSFSTTSGFADKDTQMPASMWFDRPLLEVNICREFVAASF